LDDGHTTVNHINSTDLDTDYDMKSITSSDSSDSAPFSRDDNDKDTMQPPHHPASTIHPTKPGLKRPHGALIDEPAGQNKKLGESNPSSIRRALEKDGPPHGILLFFQKATVEEHRNWIERTFERDAEEFESFKWKEERGQQILREKKRRNAAN
jgi:hypothetical protein